MLVFSLNNEKSQEMCCPAQRHDKKPPFQNTSLKSKYKKTQKLQAAK